jgi:hypothetical protein
MDLIEYIVKRLEHNIIIKTDQTGTSSFDMAEKLNYSSILIYFKDKIEFNRIGLELVSFFINFDFYIYFLKK